MIAQAEYKKAQQAHLQKVLTIADNPLAEFIDYKKLLLSSFFEEAWNFAGRRYEVSGDSSSMAKLINSLPVVSWKLFLTGYACERYALHASCKDMKNIQFRKNKLSQPNTSLHLSQCLLEFKKCRFDIEKYKDGAYASIKGMSALKRVEKRENAFDLLDSKLVYPGSFENGRRR